MPQSRRPLIETRRDQMFPALEPAEVGRQHAFLRDEGPRYDPALAYHCYGLVFELFHRRLGSGDLGRFK
jgi:carboxymethylenebutenolidase